MTNREWMESLSDEDLSKFLTVGLPKVIEISSNLPICHTIYISIKDIARNYTLSDAGILQWLNEIHTD